LVGVVTVNGQTPPPKRRARITATGEPIVGQAFELEAVGGPDGRPGTRFTAYLIEPENLHVEDLAIDLDTGGPAPIDTSADGDGGPSHGSPLRGRDRRGGRLRGWRRGDRADRPRIGWSLVIAAIADGTVGVAAIVSGSTLIGLASSIAVGISSIVLVVAEAINQFGGRRD
jgi:hypothetical protein